MKDKKNIVLIGMPSSGKSTIGKKLSQVLGLDFVDTDVLIKQRENKELRDIVNIEGLNKFLSIQEEVLIGLDVQNSIVATGGSVVYNDVGIQHIKNSGIVIYLMLDFNEIEERITSSRRFARGKEQSFYDIYLERTPLYEKYADFTIKCSGKSVEEITEEIAKILEKKV